MFYVGLIESSAEPAERFDARISAKTWASPTTWLSYIHGRTARVKATGDVLTGFMSGCWITQWTEPTGRYVGHLGTIESGWKERPPNSTVKTTFGRTMPLNTTGYNPADGFDPGQFMPLLRTMRGTPSAQVMSLVTSGNVFYSILMMERMTERGIWICGGKVRMPPVAYQPLSL